MNCVYTRNLGANLWLLLGAKSMPFGCMSMARLGAKSAEVGCKVYGYFWVHVYAFWVHVWPSKTRALWPRPGNPPT